MELNSRPKLLQSRELSYRPTVLSEDSGREKTVSGKLSFFRTFINEVDVLVF